MRKNRAYRTLLLLAHELLDSLRFDQPVDDDVRYVHTLRTELAGERLACHGRNVKPGKAGAGRDVLSPLRANLVGA
jgi:hypothetical protein